MKTKKMHKVIKAAIEYFSSAAGAAAFIIGMIALVVIVPPFISVPIIIGIGITVGVYGARARWKRLSEQEAKELLTKHEADLQNELLKRLDNGIEKIAKAEIAVETKLDNVEHKIQEKLQEEEPPGQCENPRLRQRLENNKITLCPSEEKNRESAPEIRINISNMPGFFTFKTYKDSSGHLVASVAEDSPEQQTRRVA